MMKSILEGIVDGNGLLQKCFGKYGTKTGARKYLNQPTFPGTFLNEIYNRICENYENGCDSKSPENWRFKLLPGYDRGKNISDEKILEKEIAVWADKYDRENWANQVPTASGLCSPRDSGHRNIDIIYKAGDRIYEFIELKINADNPLFAAIEIVNYALLYLFFRREKLNEGDQNLLSAKEINLKVVAPTQYYEGYDGLCVFEEMLSRYMLNFSSSRFQIQISFAFEHFPWEEKWKPEQQRQSFLKKRKRLCFQ